MVSSVTESSHVSDILWYQYQWHSIHHVLVAYLFSSIGEAARNGGLGGSTWLNLGSQRVHKSTNSYYIWLWNVEREKEMVRDSVWEMPSLTNVSTRLSPCLFCGFGNVHWGVLVCVWAILWKKNLKNYLCVQWSMLYFNGSDMIHHKYRFDFWTLSTFCKESSTIFSIFLFLNPRVWG